MFFIISKTLAFLLQPVNWVLGTLLYAYFSKNEVRKKRAFQLGLILFLFFTNHFMFNQAMKLWEPDPILLADVKEYDIGILLGGFSNMFVADSPDRHHFSDRANRLTHTLELYKLGKIKKILLSGGSGNIFNQVNSEANVAYQFLTKIGIPPEDLILEPKSRNTYENALFSKKILEEQFTNQSCLLITSAFHMRRSAACFRKVGLDIDNLPVDHIGEITRFHPESLFIPDRKGFYRWEIIIREIVGNIVYWLKGYR